MARMVTIDGNTYPAKEQLKAIGAKWNPALKVWMVEEDKADKARQIVASAGPAKPRTGNHGYERARGGYRKMCKTGGNCSSFGSGRSCGGWDCDGY